jgi:hypothetical protein
MRHWRLLVKTNLLVAVLVAGAAVSPGGCGKKGKAARGPGQDGAVNAGLAHQSPHLPQSLPKYDQAQLDKLAAESINLQEMLASRPPEPAAPEPAAPEQPVTPPVAAATPAPEVAPEPVLPPPAPPKPLAERVKETTVTLVDLLTQQAVGEGSVNAYLALAAMEVLHPGALGTMITPETTQAALVSQADKQAIETLQAYLAAVMRTGDARQLGAKMAEHAPMLMAQAALRVQNVQLCSEVSGFGQYTPLGTGTFVRGRPIRAVVYAEVDGFSYRALNEADRASARVSGRELGDGWAVEISQELKLYHRSDDLVVWERPEQSVVEMSRNKRRDFYLVQTVSLPANLSLGSYSLKVIVRDRNRGAVSEAIIPIDIVADASLAAETRESREP